MFIEEFDTQIVSYKNFKLAVKFSELCYSDPLTVNWNVEKDVNFYRFSVIENLRIFYFLIRDQLVLVFNTEAGLRSLSSYINNPAGQINKIKTLITNTISEINYRNIYCVGHAAAGVYATILANELDCSNAITIGALPLPNKPALVSRLNKYNWIQFKKDNDLLSATQSFLGCTLYLTTGEKAVTIVEGVANNSIDSYIEYANTHSFIKQSMSHVCLSTA